MSKEQGAMPSGGPVVLVLTGPHGVGKSAHAGWLRAGLRNAGVRATLWTIAPPPAECVTPFDKAMHYAMDRLRALHYARGIESEVMVVARWDESTHAAARAVQRADATGDLMAEAMQELATREAALRNVPVYRQLLDAPDAELDARMQRRCGRAQTPRGCATGCNPARRSSPIAPPRPFAPTSSPGRSGCLSVTTAHRARRSHEGSVQGCRPCARSACVAGRAERRTGRRTSGEQRCETTRR
jgi:hypothetical protein